MKKAYLVTGSRTPFFKAGTDAKHIHAADLGQIALSDALAKLDVPRRDLNSSIDEVIVGNTGTPSDAVNIARVVALRAGLSERISAYSVHRNCASALESVAQAVLKVQSGRADVIVAGGTENMSQMPLLYNKNSIQFFEKMSKAKTGGQRLSLLSKLPLKSFLKPRVSLLEGLTDPFVHINMGQTAEVLAKDFNISRSEQDSFALDSHKKSTRAIKEGLFSDEMMKFSVPPKFSQVVDWDTGVRQEQTIEALTKLRPFFDKKFGSITAGNSSQITDGAAMVIIASEEGLAKLGNVKPLAIIKDFAFAGLEPKRMGLGPVYATQKLNKQMGAKLSDYQRVEINEAFSAQVIACLRAFSSAGFCQENFGEGAMGDIDPNILNPNGGAVAIGHPVGATGTRLVLTLAHELQRSKKELGLASLCIGGGQGGAMALEAVA